MERINNRRDNRRKRRSSGRSRRNRNGSVSAIENSTRHGGGRGRGRGKNGGKFGIILLVAVVVISLFVGLFFLFRTSDQSILRIVSVIEAIVVLICVTVCYFVVKGKTDKPNREKESSALPEQERPHRRRKKDRGKNDSKLWILLILFSVFLLGVIVFFLFYSPNNTAWKWIAIVEAIALIISLSFTVVGSVSVVSQRFLIVMALVIPLVTVSSTTLLVVCPETIVYVEPYSPTPEEHGFGHDEDPISPNFPSMDENEPAWSRPSHSSSNISIYLSATLFVVMLICYIVAKNKSKNGDLIVTVNTFDKVCLILSPILFFVAWCIGFKNTLSIVLLCISGMALLYSLFLSITNNKTIMYIILSIVAKLFVFVLINLLLILLLIIILFSIFHAFSQASERREEKWYVEYDEFLDKIICYRVY